MTMPSNPQLPIGQLQLGMTNFFPAAVFVILLTPSVFVAVLLGAENPAVGMFSRCLRTAG